MEYQLPTARQADTLQRFMEEPKFEELLALCQLDNSLKSQIDVAIIELELFQGVDTDDHPYINELEEQREEVREEIRLIMRNRFANNHPINQVFENDKWTGKVLIKSMIDFSDVGNWQ